MIRVSELETLCPWLTSTEPVDADAAVIGIINAHRSMRQEETDGAARRSTYIERAQDFHAISDGALEVDDNAIVSFGDDKGAYVEAWIWVDDDHERHYECDACCERWTMDELDPIKDYHERVSEGEAIPDGECPDCGCLCHNMIEQNDRPESKEST